MLFELWCSVARLGWPSKSGPEAIFFYFDFQCASCHNSVHLFNISTSKSGLNLWCFSTFWLQNLLRPTRRALFFDISIPKAVQTCGSLNIWLAHVCRAQRRATFFKISASKVAERVVFWCVLSNLTSKCASRTLACTFFDISTSKSGPRV